MKTLKLFLFVLISLFQFGVLNGQLTQPINTEVVYYYPTADEITIDGIADEAFWSESKTCNILFNSPVDFGGDADLSGEFRIFCNRYAFYFYSEVQDNEAHNFDGVDGNSWMFDNVELFFNIDTSGTSLSGNYSPDAIQLRFNRGLSGANGLPGWGNGEPAKDEGYDNPMLQYAQVEYSTHWTLEAEIPWNYIVPSGTLPEDINDYVESFLGKSIGFDISFADSDGTDPDVGDRDAQIAWDQDGEGIGNEDNAWQDVRKFGILELLVGSGSDAPVADAGEDQSVDELDMVTLDGSASIDYQGDPLSYFWVAPDSIELTSSTSAIVQFQAPQVLSDTTVFFTLTVSDGTNLSEQDTAWVTINNVNLAPTAVSGKDTTVYENDTVRLDGRLSSDAEGLELSYYWFAPNGISLDNAQIATPYFIAPEVSKDTTFNIRLIVNDGILISDPDTLAISVKNINKIPVAVAEDNVVVEPNRTVILDGSNSYDDDDDPIFFTWTLLGEGRFTDNNGWKAVYEAPDVTEDINVQVILVVNDGKDDSKGDTVNIFVDYTLVGIDETLDKADISIFPNPANKFFDIVISGYDLTNSNQLILIDVTGREIATYQISSAQARIYLDENILPGLYFIKLLNNNKLIGLKKLHIIK